MTREMSPLGSQKDRKTLYNKGEQKLAQRLGGRRQPGSGSIEGYKGDVVTKSFLIDQKVTEHGSFRVTGGALNKIVFEARQAGKHPALEIELSVAPTTPKEWILIPLDVFDEFRKMYDGLKEIKNQEAEAEKAARASGGAPRAGTGTGATIGCDGLGGADDIDPIDPSAKTQTAEIEKERDAKVGGSRYTTDGDLTGVRFTF